MAMTRKTGFFVACLCFLLHAGLIAHHLWYDASAANTKRPPPPPTFFEPGLLQPWHSSFDLNRWDAGLYEAIARDGYVAGNHPSRTSHLVRFYPGLPLMVRAVVRVTSWPVPQALSFLSLLFTFSFWVLLWTPRLVRRLGTRATALTSVCVICWPGAFFWFAGMTEPILATLGLVVLRSEFLGRRWRTAAVLGLGTLVKHAFIPLSLAWTGLMLLRERERIWRVLTWGAVACWGFGLFALYCWLRFGDPLQMFHAIVSAGPVQIRWTALVDLSHYAAQLETSGGVVAFGGLLFLLGWFLWNVPCAGAGELLAGATAGDPSGDGLIIWWASLSMTCFFIVGNAHFTETFKPFTSLLRYQTGNVFLFLLVGRTLARLEPGRLAVLALPVCVVGIFWQSIFTVRYWNWWWVA